MKNTPIITSGRNAKNLLLSIRRTRNPIWILQELHVDMGSLEIALLFYYMTSAILVDVFFHYFWGCGLEV